MKPYLITIKITPMHCKPYHEEARMIAYNDDDAERQGRALCEAVQSPSIRYEYLSYREAP